MEKQEVTKILAESLRSLTIKLDNLYALTRMDVYEYLCELDALRHLLYGLLDVPPWESDEEIVDDYLQGKIDYNEMLSRIAEAQKAFDPNTYAKYVKAVSDNE